ncbi:hypothetical protein Tco_0265017 [Tanacetum coccineum]
MALSMAESIALNDALWLLADRLRIGTLQSFVIRMSQSKEANPSSINDVLKPQSFLQCLPIYTTLSRLRSFGMYNKKNIDYAYLLWEDFIFKIENKSTKKGSAMYYPRFTKIVVNYVMEKDPSIPRRNKTIPPKTKGSKKKANTDAIPKQKAPTAPKEKKSGKRKQKTTELENISEADLTEAEQLKIAIKRSRQETHSSHASGSGADEGTGVTPGVPDAPDYDSEDNDQEDDDAHDDDKKAENDDDEELTESDNDGDDFVHPKLTTHDEEIIHEENTEEDDSNEDATDENQGNERQSKDNQYHLDERQIRNDQMLKTLIVTPNSRIS